ncbi:MAG: hypothetical protein V3S01_06870 [Dehalococcoidia bacterium]
MDVERPREDIVRELEGARDQLERTADEYANQARQLIAYEGKVEGLELALHDLDNDEFEDDDDDDNCDSDDTEDLASAGAIALARKELAADGVIGCDTYIALTTLGIDPNTIEVA